MRGTRTSWRVVSAACLIIWAAASCCAGPLIRSQRMPQEEWSGTEGHPHEHRQRLRDVAHAVGPYVAGPFHRRHHDPTQYAATQATIKPPHSKFHPVPTRPVFEPRGTYSPPRPIVDLVPVPEPHLVPHGAGEMMYPDLGLPPLPENVGFGPLEFYEGDSMPWVAPDE